MIDSNTQERRCVVCYNTITYKTPMTAGGLEPPKPQATEFQAQPVCRFQHAVAKGGEECFRQVVTPPPTPQLTKYHSTPSVVNTIFMHKIVLTIVNSYAIISRQKREVTYASMPVLL